MKPTLPNEEQVEALWKKAKEAGMPRRRFLMLLAGSGAAAVLAACAPSVSTTAPSATTKPPAATTPAASPKPSVTPLATTTSSGVIKWRGQTMNALSTAPYGPFTPQAGAHLETVYFCQWLEKATNGRLVIDWVGPGALFPDADADLSVAKGVVDIAYEYPPYWVGRMPEADIQAGPVLAYRNTQEQWECYNKYGLDKLIREAYAEKGLYVLHTVGNAITPMGTTFAAPNLASVKGKKIRGYGSWLNYIELIGAAPVTAPLGDVYMGLKLGTYDGWVAGVGKLDELKWKEVTKGLIVKPEIAAAASCYIINQKSFDALPSDIKQILDVSAPAAAYAAGHTWRTQCQWSIDNAVANNSLQVYSWPESEVNAITDKVVNQMYPAMASKNARCGKMIDIIRKQMKDYMRIK